MAKGLILILSMCRKMKWKNMIKSSDLNDLNALIVTNLYIMQTKKN